MFNLEITSDNKKTVAEILKEKQIKVSLPCGGAGLCLNCRVRFLNHAPKATDKEALHLKINELEKGMRLACLSVPKENCTIDLLCQDEIVTVLDEDIYLTEGFDREAAELYIACDIGTTTIAAALTDRKSKSILATAKCVNSGRIYGDDVLSRIQAANDGKGEELKKLLLEDLEVIRTRLTEELNQMQCLDNIPFLIAGNTTMEHLLMGYPCETLGVAPFQPYQVNTVMAEDQVQLENKKVIQRKYLLPCPSAFIGADILSGIYKLNLNERKGNYLFIDMGTNGEAVLAIDGKLLATSAACGPALEGGQISKGLPAIPGAIYSCTIQHGFSRIKTIGDSSPIGICGSGLIEAIAELLDNQMIDKEGKLIDRYFVEGFPIYRVNQASAIYITQDDIHALQLAKAAIRTAVEFLLRYGEIHAEEINRVFIAGGFGNSLDLEKLCHIGLLPEGLQGKLEYCGNTSLSGLLQLIWNCDGPITLDQILDRISGVQIETLQLAEQTGFEESFVDYLNFAE